jgi:hypothetical protein
MTLRSIGKSLLWLFVAIWIASFFNIWNHTQWQIFSGRSGGGYGQPGFGNASFGRVTAARDPRIIQLAMKFMF